MRSSHFIRIRISPFLPIWRIYCSEIHSIKINLENLFNFSVECLQTFKIKTSLQMSNLHLINTLDKSEENHLKQVYGENSIKRRECPDSPLSISSYCSLSLKGLPLILEPLWRLAHIVAVRDENLPTFPVGRKTMMLVLTHLCVPGDVPGGEDAGDHSVLGMSELHELRVGSEAVIGLVSQSCGVCRGPLSWMLFTVNSKH